MRDAPSNEPDGPISHGICIPCVKEVFRGMSEPLQDFLDRLEEPVLLMGSGPKVVTANKRACEILQKDLSQVEGFKGGHVMECVHAQSPGGCGKQIHCQSCTIRNTVLETFKTGKSFEQVPAYLDIERADEQREMCLRISTEKAGDVVLLRIDDIRESDPEQRSSVA